jgi:DNA modification methylase
MTAASGGAAPYYASPSGDVVLYQGDAAAVLRALPAGSVHCCITSPPYFALRDYGTATWEGGDAGCDHRAPSRFDYKLNPGLGPTGVQTQASNAGSNGSAQYRAVCGKCGARRVDAQIGLEESPDDYVAALVAVFREVRRVLHSSGCLWLNCGDSYAAHGRMVTDAPPHKDLAAASARHKNGPSVGRVTGFPRKGLMMIPSRVAIALQEDGWLLRAMIPWLKRSAMPESATDRPTTATEYVFLLAKSERYFYDADAVRVPQSAGTFERYGNGKAPRKTTTKAYAANEGEVRANAGFKDATPEAILPNGRNRRNADWWFDSLRAILAGATGLLADEDGEPLALPVNPAAYPGAHFATFSPKLVEPMVLASTSARGACGRCGSPWVRVTETSYVPHGDSAKSQQKTTFGERASGDFEKGRLRPQEMPHGRATRVDRTTGWRAGCACENAGDPVPCLCLDPFAGSGTVGVVARKHGRHFVGVDLSAAYLDLARERLGQLALPGWSGAAAGG